MTQFLHDWWQFLAYVGALLVGIVLGHARRAYTLETLNAQQALLERRVETLEKQQALGNTSSAVQANDLKHIREQVDAIHRRLDQMGERR